MRVTQGMLSNNMLNNLMKSQGKMDKYMEQLYTGKKINRPSDDPVIAMKGMNFRGQVMEVEQYKRNIGEVHNWMDNSDSALNQANEAIQRIRELAVQASNSTYSDSELKSIREEVEQLREQLVDIANTSVNGKHIFNGTNTNKKAIDFDEDPPYNFKNDNIEIEVYKEIEIIANVQGEEIFGEELVNTINSFIDKLDPPEDAEVEDDVSIGDSLSAIDKQIDKFIDARADLGARMNRLELVENRVEEQEVIAKKTMSKNEDIEFEEAITNLITQESLYRAALSAGSRIIQPSLVDFLR